MLDLTIGGKEYHIEFTIEASLYNECTEKVAGLFASIGEAADKAQIKGIVSSLADIPQTTLTMLYAGLLEHHGEDGDGTILSKKDAKKLIVQYLKEHKDDDTGSFYGIMEILIDQMGKDGFFEMTGLNKVLAQIQKAENQEKEEQKTPKAPQDHKKKATKK